MDDELKDLMGGGDDAEADDNYAMVVPRRAVNVVEQELRERLILEAPAEPVFLQDDDTDDDRRRAAAQSAIAEIEQQPIAEKWGPRIALARSLGPNGTNAAYEAACQERGWTPWPKN